MSRPKYYSPAIRRFLISALYHEARGFAFIVVPHGFSDFMLPWPGFKQCVDSLLIVRHGGRFERLGVLFVTRDDRTEAALGIGTKCIKEEDFAVLGGLSLFGDFAFVLFQIGKPQLGNRDRLRLQTFDDELAVHPQSGIVFSGSNVTNQICELGRSPFWCRTSGLGPRLFCFMRAVSKGQVRDFHSVLSACG